MNHNRTRTTNSSFFSMLFIELTTTRSELCLKHRKQRLSSTLWGSVCKISMLLLEFTRTRALYHTRGIANSEYRAHNPIKHSRIGLCAVHGIQKYAHPRLHSKDRVTLSKFNPMLFNRIYVVIRPPLYSQHYN
jgi:hypothetical protein